MNKRIGLFLTVIITVLVLYTNEYLKIEYNITVWDYIKLSSDLTDEEKLLLEKSDVLIYGGNINEPPLGIYYEANKQYIGLVVDYINALSIELGTTIVSRPMVWNDALTALSEERTDICDMIPSDERAKDFAFSDPLYDLKGVVLLPVGKNDIEFLVDLKGKRVSVQKGDYTIECLDQKGIEPIYHTTDNLAEALQLLYDGEVDAVIGDEPVIWYHLNELTNREDYQILDKPLYSEACVLAVPHSKDALIPVLNKAIFNLRRKGILNQIHTKWLGPRSNVYDKNAEEKLRLNLYVLGLVIIIGGTLIYLWNRSLKVLVAARTSELLLTKD
jgi:polar amino acid transport system substrate-binding protein